MSGQPRPLIGRGQSLSVCAFATFCHRVALSDTTTSRRVPADSTNRTSHSAGDCNPHSAVIESTALTRALLDGSEAAPRQADAPKSDRPLGRVCSVGYLSSLPTVAAPLFALCTGRPLVGYSRSRAAASRSTALCVDFDERRAILDTCRTAIDTISHAELLLVGTRPVVRADLSHVSRHFGSDLRGRPLDKREPPGTVVFRPDPEIPDARASGWILPIPAKSGFRESRFSDPGPGHIGISRAAAAPDRRSWLYRLHQASFIARIFGMMRQSQSPVSRQTTAMCRAAGLLRGHRETISQLRKSRGLFTSL